MGQPGEQPGLREPGPREGLAAHKGGGRVPQGRNPVRKHLYTEWNIVSLVFGFLTVDDPLSGSDYKETMEIGEDANLVSPWPNKWPASEDVPGFKDFMNAFFDRCHFLHLKVSPEASPAPTCPAGVARLYLTTLPDSCGGTGRSCKRSRSASACLSPSSMTSVTRRPTTSACESLSYDVMSSEARPRSGSADPF